MVKIVKESVSCTKCMVTGNSIFRNLTRSELAMVNHGKTCAFYRKGSIVYNEGLRLNHFYCLNRGVLKMFRTGIYGKEQIIGFIKKGEIIGYRAILTGEPSGSTVKVVEDAHICVIPSELLFTFINNNSSFSLSLIQQLSREVNRYSEEITDLAQKSVRERLARVLLMLKDTFELDPNSFIKLNLTREDLANLVGTATETIIRLLSEFKSDRIIELQGRKIRIINLQTLVKLANM